jgi:hypothetical protein
MFGLIPRSARFFDHFEAHRCEDVANVVEQTMLELD